MYVSIPTEFSGISCADDEQNILTMELKLIEQKLMDNNDASSIDQNKVNQSFDHLNILFIWNELKFNKREVKLSHWK